MLEKFYYETELINNSKDVKITTNNLLYGGPEYLKESIIISRHSIQLFIATLLDPAYIPRHEKTVVKTDYDYIEIHYGGADDSPIVQFYNRRKVITGINSDRSGPVAIPLDAWGKEDYLYINPLIDDLKKYQM